MSNYVSDRKFTDFVHEKLAKPQIYSKINWVVQELDAVLAKNVDVNNSVDYFAIDQNNNKLITIQERFRERKYSSYNDFTIRYKREYNDHSDRILSEYFKLNVDYFVYGIIDQDKENVDANGKFLKIAIIDVKALNDCVNNGLIVIDEKINTKFCKIDKGKLICPVITNFDYSSSFVPLDVQLLIKLFSNKVVVYQKGFK